MISDREWKEFRIIELLGKSHNSKPYHSNCLCETSEPGIPYVTRTSFNNGLYSIVCNDNYKLNPSNSISFGAENAEYFFQPSCYITGNKMYYYFNNEYNRYIALFMVQCLNKAIYNCGFGYGMGLTGTRSDTRKIMLPVNENKEPDYAFMEAYIKEQEQKKIQEYVAYAKIKLSKLEYKDVPVLNEKDYSNFKVLDLFSYKRGNQNNMNSLVDGNDMLISAKNINNGLKGFFISNNEKKRAYQGNCITLNNDGDGGVGLAYYQPHEFLLDTHVYALYPKNKISKYTMLYISLSLSKQRVCFSHGRSISQDRLKKMRIMLPVDNQGNPDYAYMEQYAKNVEYKKITQYLEYINKLKD